MTTVLIVDDEAPLLRNLKGYLESLGGRFTVLTATTAEAALAMLRKERELDVLVTDVRLPGMNGIELVRETRALRPELPVVVISAFGTETIKQEARSQGALRFLEKPVDLDRFREVLEEAVSAGGWSGRIGGLDIFDITQLLAMSGRKLRVRVTYKGSTGVLGFENGRLVHAATERLRGEEAFFEMVRWAGGTFEELPEDKGRAADANVSMPLSQLMIEAARRRDEERHESSVGSSAAAEERGRGEVQTVVRDRGATRDADRKTRGEESQMAVKDHLQELTGIQGFKAAAVFTAQGEILESVSTGKIDIKSAGIYANNALLNAQKATDQMGVGVGTVVVVEAPKAITIMRCFNESTDFAATKAGKAHFHTIVLLDPDGNIGMVKMMLDKVIEKIAEELR